MPKYYYSKWTWITASPYFTIEHMMRAIWQKLFTPKNAVFHCFFSSRPPILINLNCDTIFSRVHATLSYSVGWSVCRLVGRSVRVIQFLIAYFAVLRLAISSLEQNTEICLNSATSMLHKFSMLPHTPNSSLYSELYRGVLHVLKTLRLQLLPHL